MIAVGIDVSKSKSTVAILNGDGSICAKPFAVHHVADELHTLVDYIKRSSESPTILLEPTSHYHYPLLKAFQEADLPVCLINPYQMKKYGDTELRKAKTDKRDALRIAQYALEKSYSLVPYTPQDQKYEDLRFLSRQYSQRISTLTVAKVQLLSLLDETMPGITTITGSSPRPCAAAQSRSRTSTIPCRSPRPCCSAASRSASPASSSGTPPGDALQTARRQTRSSCHTSAPAGKSADRTIKRGLRHEISPFDGRRRADMRDRPVSRSQRRRRATREGAAGAVQTRGRAPRYG